VPIGTLVEFKWTPPDGRPVRSLAIVLHHKPEPFCIGIEFVNFIGEGRSALDASSRKPRRRPRHGKLAWEFAFEDEFPPVRS